MSEIPKKKNYRETADHQIIPYDQIKSRKAQKPRRNNKPDFQTQDCPMIPSHDFNYNQRKNNNKKTSASNSKYQKQTPRRIGGEFEAQVIS